ncbi:MAG: YtxH domain-containing protein [Cyanobacteria bacterium P01_A01_bin.135]
MPNQGGRAAAFASGVILGAAAGAIASLLSTPRTGKETRRLLKQSADTLPDLAEDLSNRVQVRADRVTISALRNLDDTLVRLKEAIAVGIEVGQREQREGERVASSTKSE